MVIEAANTITGLRIGGFDPKALITLDRDDQFIHLLPSIDFEDQCRFRQGTQATEMIDYLSTGLFSSWPGRHNGGMT